MSESAEQGRFNALLDELTTIIKDSKSFALEQAPDIAKQLVAEKGVELKYNLINCFIGNAASLAVLALCLYYPQNSEGWLLIRGLIGATALVCSLISLVETLGTFSQLAQLKVAPKVFLLRQLRKLVK